MRNARDIIIRPLVTEKTTAQIAQNRYTFVVARDAGKIAIRRALEEIFNVKVKDVNTMQMHGKKKRVGRYPVGVRPRWKKAVVTLREGSKPIEIFEGR